jgi:cupin fold WbuC family metalloprotein
MNVTKNSKVYGIIHKKNAWKKGLDFLTPDETYCQVGTWLYDKGKILQAHKHITNERPNSITQECVVVVEGSLRVDFYDDDNQVFHSEFLTSGDFAIMLEGGHGYIILEDNTRIIECKNGPFLSVEKDKVAIG